MIYQCAFKPRPIDQDATEEFYNRWMSMIASALEGNLTRPRRAFLYDLVGARKSIYKKGLHP